MCSVARWGPAVAELLVVPDVTALVVTGLRSLGLSATVSGRLPAMTSAGLTRGPHLQVDVTGGESGRLLVIADVTVHAWAAREDEAVALVSRAVGMLEDCRAPGLPWVRAQSVPYDNPHPDYPGVYRASCHVAVRMRRVPLAP